MVQDETVTAAACHILRAKLHQRQRLPPRQPGSTGGRVVGPRVPREPGPRRSPAQSLSLKKELQKLEEKLQLASVSWLMGYNSILNPPYLALNVCILSKKMLPFQWGK